MRKEGSVFKSSNHTSLIQVNDLFLSMTYQKTDFKGSHSIKITQDKTSSRSISTFMAIWVAQPFTTRKSDWPCNMNQCDWRYSNQECCRASHALYLVQSHTWWEAAWEQVLTQCHKTLSREPTSMAFLQKEPCKPNAYWDAQQFER